MNADFFVHVVDDDEAVRDSLSFALSASGLVVRAYPSALELLSHAPALEPGVIITDVRMPGMTGLELVARLNQIGASHPIIVLTGHADVGMAVDAMKAGVVDFIEKPFDDADSVERSGGGAPAFRRRSEPSGRAQ